MPIFRNPSLQLMLLFLAELGIITFARSNINPHITPILLLILPIGFGIISLKSAKNGDLSLNINPSLPIISWFFAIALITYVFAKTPISLLLSDTIPIMLSAVRKCLTGEFPYTPVEEGWGYTAFCTYMPMHWLPLMLPYSLGIDVRWIGVLLFMGINILFFLQNKQKTLRLLFPPLFLLIIPIHEFQLLGQTMELMIVAYYMFLIYALFSGKISLQIIAFSLCLLSRYSVVLWLPLWVGLMFFYDSKSKALKLIFGIIIAVLLIYILPFWSKDTSIFSQAMQYYDASSANLWQMLGDWQKAGETPYILKGGSSLAIYFYEYLDGNIPYKLQFLKYTQLILSMLFIGIAFVSYPFFRKKISYQNYAIYCLPIYLGIFYAFMLVPFMYLQLVPCGVMMAILLYQRQTD